MCHVQSFLKIKRSSNMTDSVLDGKKMKAGSFQSLGLHQELLNGLNRMGYKTPTPVQRKALPLALAGVDLVCMARTGSGKTCVFLLPMIEKVKTHQSNLGVRGLVLSPTRELAMQTFKFARDMAKFTDIRLISIVGGDPIEAQFEALATRPDIIIATPGRLMHHLREISTFKLKQVQYLVFDEADRLFEMGFAEQLNEIVTQCPEERQTLLFSATMPKMLIQFSRAGLRDPQLIRLDTDTKMSSDLRMGYFLVRSNEKVAALLYLVRSIIPADQLTIIFTATRHHSEFLHSLFNRVGISSTVVYGSMDQDARSSNLRSFKNGEVSYMIVTDLAARGIDVPLLNNVINFHFPPSPKLFVHRCGRAARQGRVGFAFSLVEPDELAFMYDVQMYVGSDLRTEYDPLIDGELGGSDSSSSHSASSKGYTLSTMTPSMIHTGLFPQDMLDRENDYLKNSLQEEDQLRIMWRICENGMKQYRRTRQEASHTGVKSAKALVKLNKVKKLHPLIIGMDPEQCTDFVVAKADFVRQLQTFRPSQTVFESGIGYGTGSQAVKAKSRPGTKESHGVQMMQALRKGFQSSLERNKSKVTLSQDILNPDDDNSDDGDIVTTYKGNIWENLEDDEFGVGKDEFDNDGVSVRSVDTAGSAGSFADSFLKVGGASRKKRHGGIDPGTKSSSVLDSEELSDDEDDVSSLQGNSGKIRLSRALRKKIKGSGVSASKLGKIDSLKVALMKQKLRLAEVGITVSDSSRTSKGTRNGGYSGSGSGEKFKDRKFYMTYGNEDEVQNFVEDSLQPQSGLRSSEIQGAQQLESAMLDLTPEDALAMNNKRRMLRWDAKKRKFVKQTLEESAQAKGAKRVRTETGVIVGKKSLVPAGEMYSKWQKKSRREVGGFDNDEESGSVGPERSGRGGPGRGGPGRGGGGRGGRGGYPGRSDSPNFKFNSNVPNELKNAHDIRKLRKEKDNQKLKNLPKEKRRLVEAAGRKKKQSLQALKRENGPTRGSMKSKAIIRY